MPDFNQLRLCAICSDPVDVEGGHSVHEPDCFGDAGQTPPGCQCDLLVHPGCCPAPACRGAVS
jgi:hypothetical protein